jgi:hypothetical protein
VQRKLSFTAAQAQTLRRMLAARSEGEEGKSGPAIVAGDAALNSFRP